MPKLLAMLIAALAFQFATAEPKNIAQEAKAIATADGHKKPELFVALLEVESKLGKAPKYMHNGTCYGLGQVTIGAAMAVAKLFPELAVPKRELAYKLAHDDTYNMKVASKYLVMLGAASDPNRALAAYNTGLKVKHPEHNPYVIKVHKASKALAI